MTSKKAKPKRNPAVDAVTSHLAYFKPTHNRVYVVYEHERGNEAQKQKQVPRLRACAPLPRASNHVGKGGQKFSRFRSVQKFMKFNETS